MRHPREHTRPAASPTRHRPARLRARHSNFESERGVSMSIRPRARFVACLSIGLAMAVWNPLMGDEPEAPDRSSRRRTGWSSATWSSGASRTSACWRPSAPSLATASSPRHQSSGVRRRVDPDRPGPDDHRTVRGRLHDRGARSQAHRPGVRGRHGIGLPGRDPLEAREGGLLGRDSRAPEQAGDAGPEGTGLHQRQDPGRRRLCGLARGRPIRRDHRDLAPRAVPLPWSSN